MAFLKHKLFNLEVVSCALYLVGVTELPFKLLALQAKITALYLMVNNNRFPDVFQRKRKRGRPAAWRITQLPVKMFTCHSCLLSSLFPRVSTARFERLCSKLDHNSFLIFPYSYALF